MKIGTSLLLVAVGLVLAYAVDFEVPGVEIGTLGSILFFVGLLGLVVSVGLEVAARRPPRQPRQPRSRSEPRTPVAEPRPRWEPVVDRRAPAPRPRDPADEETRRLR